jgi:hypothetical protein
MILNTILSQRCATGPPKDVSPSRKKTQNTSQIFLARVIGDIVQQNKNLRDEFAEVEDMVVQNN